MPRYPIFLEGVLFLFKVSQMTKFNYDLLKVGKMTNFNFQIHGEFKFSIHGECLILRVNQVVSVVTWPTKKISPKKVI